MSKFLVLVFFVLLSRALFGQVPSQEVNNNPYNVIYNHLYYLQDEHYDKSKAALSFRNEDQEKAEKYAIKLKQILDGNGVYIQMSSLPTAANYTDSVTNNSTYVLDKQFPQIYLEKINGKWYYSKETESKIPQLYKLVFPFGIHLQQYFVGSFWNQEFLGIKIWQYLCLLLMLVVFYIIFVLLNALFSIVFKLIKKSTVLSSVLNDDLSTKKVRRLLSLLLSTIVVKVFIPLLTLPPLITAILLKGLDILSIFFILFLVLKIVSVIFDALKKSADKTESKMDDQLLPVLQKIVVSVVWIIGLVYVLSYLNLNLTAILAGLSIGGLALALAAQDTVKNFFGSVMIFLDRPFQIGDWIHFDDVDGIVEEVGIRSTRIRTFSNSLVYVPNAHLADATIDNMGLRQFRRYKTTLGVTYDTNPEIINVFVEGIKEIIMIHPTTRKDYFEVSLEGFGASSLNILLYCFFEADDWSKELKGKHEVNYAIIKLANDLGVRFAFPTQTIHIEDFPEKNSLTPIAQTLSKAQTGKENSVNEIKNYFSSSSDKNSTADKKPLGGA